MFAWAAFAVESSFSVHSCFGDGMVVQRGKPVRISGTATPRTVIKGRFRGAEAKAEVGVDGAWELEFPAGEAGGPFDLAVWTPVATTELRDILVGEVWICTGQSNMEYPVGTMRPFWGYPDGDAAAAEGDPSIRLFHVQRGLCPDGPCDEVPGRSKWRRGDDIGAVKRFSAVGWFFGLELRRRLGPDVPIGLVCDCWGGTKIESWISEATLEANGEAYALEKLAKAKDISNLTPDDDTAANKRLRANLAAWLRDKYFGPHAAESAAAAGWAAPELPDGEAAMWKRGPRASGGGLLKVGVTWHRREFTLPDGWAGRQAILRMKRVDDCDETFVDGVKIGATGIETPKYWMHEREYRFTVGAADGGRHVLAIRHQNHFGTGHFDGPVTVALADGSGEPVELQGGEWMERVEFHVDPKVTGVRPEPPEADQVQRESPHVPATLFNAMIRPMTFLNMRGAIWYQGCSNAGFPKKYRDYQREIVEDWRSAWKDPSFVFIGTQLSAFRTHTPKSRLADDFWKGDEPGMNLGFAPIRDSQTTLLGMPGCGLACTIDVGDHSDIHPSRKREVGVRLASEAMRLAYGDASALPGPRGASAADIGGGRVRVTVSDAGAGIEFRGEAAASGHAGPHLFALYGADGSAAWADATLDADGSIVVSAAEIAEPARVEYAWSSCPPDPCVYRKGDSIPLFPFSLEVQGRR